MSDANIRNLVKNPEVVNHSINRIDYRRTKVFTIDDGDCKCHDDAVSITKTNRGWKLGVYITDVAASAKMGSKLDSTAVYRSRNNTYNSLFGSELSQNKFSLLPGKCRKVMAFIFCIDSEGEVYRMQIKKAVICSRISGVYDEIDSILNSGKFYFVSEDLSKKYHKVWNELEEIKNLYNALNEKTSSNKAESYPEYISSRKIINQIMVLTGMKVCEFLVNNNLPALYRGTPGMNNSAINLEGYTSVTSPNRRLQDLKIQQILTMHLAGYTCEEIHQKFDKHLKRIQRPKKRKKPMYKAAA